MTTPFLQNALARKPLFTDTLGLPNFLGPLNELTELVRLLPESKIGIVVGPTNAGKTQLLCALAQFAINEVFRNVPDWMVPVIGAKAFVPDGIRSSPRYLIERLLEDIGHILFDPRKNPRAHSLRSKVAAGGLICALEHAMQACGTRLVLVDEGDNLVRAKSDDFKARLLEALKCLTYGGALPIIFGGYELAEVALSIRPHLAARIIPIHVRPYGKSLSDRRAWASIVSAMAASSYLKIPDPTLLTEMADELLVACHGLIGLLESVLIDAQIKSSICDKGISRKLILDSPPRSVAWAAIDLDVRRGKRVMDEFFDPAAKQKASAVKKGADTKTKRPFERSPTRTHPRE
jgi:hypothetical protein